MLKTLDKDAMNKMAQSNSESVISATFTVSDIEILKQYFEINKKYNSEVNDALLVTLKGHPISKMNSDEQGKEENKAVLELQRAAIYDGKWEEYNSYLMAQGITYASMNISYTDWCGLVKMYKEYLIPLVKRDHSISSKQRLIFMEGLQMFFDYDMHFITQSYIKETNNILRRSIKEISDYKFTLDEFAIVAITDQKGIINYVNDNFCKISKYNREELIGQDHRIINSGYHPKEFIRGIWTTIANGKIWKGELKNKAKDGTIYWVDTTIVPFLDEQGKPYQYVAVRTDITNQKLLSKEISDYKYTLDEFAIVAITDQKGVINYVNDNFCKISKYNREELIGQDHRIINSGYHPKEFIRGIWTTIAKGKIWKGELKNIAKDGTIYWVDTTIVPFLDEQGKPYQYVAVRTDITDQKRNSEELKEARVAAELATIWAEDEKAKAESALQSKQQFLANMSHEIRTPLNAILGFTKIILKTDLAPKQKEYLDAIKTSSDGLLVLINDILDLAKVDAGKMTFEQTHFKMDFLLFTIFQVFDLKIQDKNLELVKQYDKNIPEVLIGDAMRLQQIFLNLLSNALKFTREGTITVAVRLLNEDKETATIEFAITDTGIGIAEDNIADIFENFQQATSSTSRIFGGTGLGLAICKQLVEKQGGTISVKSKVDEGSTFCFTLNFAKTNGEIKLEDGDAVLNPEIKDIKVLVVEDVKLNQLLMRVILDDFQFKYDVADNGKIAIEKLKTETYDIILMDLQMPEMNGFEATAYIRNTMNLNIPIIALTADVTTMDVEKCKSFGMNDYVSKPLDERILYSKIIELLKG
jgi:PAS domain S-box-containing protein